jgi:hypothetical protein
LIDVLLGAREERDGEALAAEAASGGPAESWAGADDGDGGHGGPSMWEFPAVARGESKVQTTRFRATGKAVPTGA